MSQKRDLYVAKMKSKLDKWSAEIDTLEAKSRQLSTSAQTRLKDQIAKLEAKRAEVGTKIESVRTASDEVWRDLRQGIENSGKELIHGVRLALADLKQPDKSPKP